MIGIKGVLKLGNRELGKGAVVWIGPYGYPLVLSVVEKAPINIGNKPNPVQTGPYDKELNYKYGFTQSFPAAENGCR